MHALANMAYAKMNGAGNEIVVLDLRASSYELSEKDARALHALTPYDQLMAIHAPKNPEADAFVLIYNNDGSQAGACGNGTRCVAWHLSRETGKARLGLETRRGLLTAWREGELTFRVDMGEPRLEWHDIPLSRSVDDTSAIDLSLAVDGAPPLRQPALCNMGNPHCVFFVEDETLYDLRVVGPQLETHPLFPEKANISIASVKDRGHVGLRVWERGVGITRACGSAACATAVSGIRRGLLERRARVSLPGGDLIIEWAADNHVLMTGPVALEAWHTLPAHFNEAAA